MSYLDILTTVGFASMAGCFVYIGRKLQVLDDLKATVDKIKANLKVVSDFLTRNNANFNSSELQGSSPLRLSPEGMRLIKDLKFDTAFDDHKKDFFQCIDSEKPRLKYDVEIAAIKSISLLYDKEYMNSLKVFFYNNPSRNLENTAPTLGVYLRDRYLAEHPEITE